MSREKQFYKDIKGMSFCIEGHFFSSHEDYIDHLAHYRALNLSEINDDWTEEVFLTEEEPMFNITAKMLTELVENSDQERFSEHGYDNEVKEIKEAFEKSVDFKILNSLIPRLWYGSGGAYIVTKDDVYDDLVKEIEG